MTKKFNKNARYHGKTMITHTANAVSRGMKSEQGTNPGYPGLIFTDGDAQYADNLKPECGNYCITV